MSKDQVKEMIVVQFYFQVPKGRIEEFAQYSKEVLKKTWESYGSTSYYAYTSVDRRIRSDQVINNNEVVEELVFDSVDDVARFFDKSNLKQGDAEAAESYEERFHVRNMHCRILKRIR
jgi:heme-degrading monooxygenase HmoA